MTQMMKVSAREFKITIISMSRALTVKADNMQDQTHNVSREMETLRKQQKGMLKIKTKQNKSSVTELRMP